MYTCKIHVHIRMDFSIQQLLLILSSLFVSQITYRDRAKERREKFGTPEAIIPGWKRRLDREMAKDPPVPLVGAFKCLNGYMNFKVRKYGSMAYSLLHRLLQQEPDNEAGAYKHYVHVSDVFFFSILHVVSYPQSTELSSLQ